MERGRHEKKWYFGVKNNINTRSKTSINRKQKTKKKTHYLCCKNKVERGGTNCYFGIKITLKHVQAYQSIGNLLAMLLE